MPLPDPVTRFLDALRGLFGGGPESRLALFAKHGERLGLIADDGACGLLLGEGRAVPREGDGIAVALDSLHGVSAETAVSLVGVAVTCRFRPMRIGRRLVNGFRTRVRDVREGDGGGLVVRLGKPGGTLFVQTGACGEEPQLEAPRARIWRGSAADVSTAPELVTSEGRTMLVNVSSVGVRFSTAQRSGPSWREGEAVVTEVLLPGEADSVPVLRGEVCTVERREGKEIVGVRFVAERGEAEDGWREIGPGAQLIDAHTLRVMRAAAPVGTAD